MGLSVGNKNHFATFWPAARTLPNVRHMFASRNHLTLRDFPQIFYSPRLV